jgi:hypothetical protein
MDVELSRRRLRLPLFSHPAFHVLAPADDAATKAEAVRPDAEMPPVAQRRHRSAENGRHLLQGQTWWRRRGRLLLVLADALLRGDYNETNRRVSDTAEKSGQDRPNLQPTRDFSPLPVRR